MFEMEEMPDARGVVDGILEQYDYVFTTLERGNLDPLSVDAVVRVALYRDEYTEWGINRLGGSWRASTVAPAPTRPTPTSSRTGVVIRGLESIIAGSAWKRSWRLRDEAQP